VLSACFTPHERRFGRGIGDDLKMRSRSDHCNGPANAFQLYEVCSQSYEALTHAFALLVVLCRAGSSWAKSLKMGMFDYHGEVKGFNIALTADLKRVGDIAEY
jgi:hypothetical protein